MSNQFESIYSPYDTLCQTNNLQSMTRTINEKEQENNLRAIMLINGVVMVIVVLGGVCAQGKKKRRII